MSCGTCGGGGGYNTNYPQQNRVIVAREIDPNCPYTHGILIIWITALKCVKNNSQLSLLEITEFQANVHIGNIQSAINYPDNYCFFSEQLLDFQQNVLPKIIQNVPSCI